MPLAGSDMVYWVSLCSGIVIVAAGIWAKSLLNDAEMAVTQEERDNPTPTFIGRVLVICLGICMVLYGLAKLFLH
jgi:hypothetical protein